MASTQPSLGTGLRGVKRAPESRPFSVAMEELLQHYGLSLPAGPVQEVYSFHFDGKPSVHFVNRKNEEYVSVISEAGQLVNMQAADILLDLLEMNRCDSVGQNAQVTVHRQSGTLIVWSRQRHAPLDMAGFKSLLHGVRQKTDAVQQRLGKSGARMSEKNGATLARMMLLSRQDRA